MMQIYVSKGFVRILVNESGVAERRKLDAKRLEHIGHLAAEYDQVLGIAGKGAADLRFPRLLEIGRGLWEWLDADDGAFTRVMREAPRPLRFEIRGPQSPTSDDLAVLRAPWELLAGEHGFLAQDEGLGYAPFRRLGAPADAPGPDEFRLGVMFMASSPRGVLELDYEAEEMAVLDAVRGGDLDLIVEDSGDPTQLGEQLARIEHPPSVVHISCHGNNDPEPFLAMEDAVGGVRHVSAAQLRDDIDPAKPRLLFVSACLSAAAKRERKDEGDENEGQAEAANQRVVHSLATALVDAGFPAVLGWSGSVSDAAATRFTREVYNRVARSMDVPRAVAAARRALLVASSEHSAGDKDAEEFRTRASTAEADVFRRDWHLARLWVGPQGGGAIVRQGARQKRLLLPADAGYTRVLQTRGESGLEVASPRMFVGRRRELQRALAALRDAHRAGVLLHGMGRLGKSSLAARIADRRHDLRLAVVYEGYDATSVLEDIRRTLGNAPRQKPEDADALRWADEIISVGIDAVRDNAAALEGVLVDLLNGPCSGNGRAILLLVDDLERVLVPGQDGARHTVEPGTNPVVRAILRAFDACTGDSRLIVTSRYRFAMDDGGRDLEGVLEAIQLPAFHDAARRKLSLRQLDAARESLDDGAADRAELLARSQKVARGNPGLHTLLGRDLALNKDASPDDASQLLDEIEAYFEAGGMPASATVGAFLQNLGLDDLVGLAGAEGREVLRSMTLFELAVPASVVEALGGPPGISGRLADLGLLEPADDVYDPKRAALVANALAAGRLEPLDEPERTDASRAATPELFKAWGGADGGGRRPYAADIELTKLGLLAGDTAVLSACAADGVRGLGRGNAAIAAAIGQNAVSLIEAKDQPVPLDLYGAVASSLLTAGDGRGAAEMLKRGGQDLDATLAKAAPGDLEVGAYLFELGNWQVRSGQLEDALHTWQRLTEHMHDQPRERAIGQGQIADILQAQGQLDEARRIREQEELPVYEQLDDVHSVAVTRGQIADILQTQGQLDEARRIREQEELPVYESLGDVRSVAVTRGQIADILQTQGQLDEARRIREQEQLPIFERLGDVRSVAVTRGRIADILQAQGQLDEARRIREEDVLPVLEQLGDVRTVAVLKQGLAHDHLRAGNTGEFRRLQGERLDTNRQLRDADGIASAQWDLAQLDLQEEKFGDAAPRVAEAYKLLEQLGRADGIAAVGPIFAQFAFGAGNKPLALAVLDRSREMAAKIGQDEKAQQIAQLKAQLESTEPPAAGPSDT